MMDKLKCIADYYAGNKAYYLFWRGKYSGYPEWRRYILENKYFVGAQIGCISNIMLGIKEDLVDNKGGFVYESKVFLKALEDSAEVISKKVSDGYKIDNYIFPDAATVVAIVRNKLAHGKYIIDFEHERVILEHKGNEMTISLYKLKTFIMKAFKSALSDVKTNKYDRSVVYFNNKSNTVRTKGFINLSEVRGVIKTFKYVEFLLESIDNEYIPKFCIDMFEQFLKAFKERPDVVLQSQLYTDLCKLLKQNGCKISYTVKKINNSKDYAEILEFFDKQVIDHSELTYLQQLEILGIEIQRKIDNKYNSFNPIAANVKNLILLDGIARNGSIDDMVLSSFANKELEKDIRFHYDEFGMSLISMFNSLFMYPFDDVYSIGGEYTPDRSSGLDFSKLDFSMIKPDVLSIADSPLVKAKEKVDSLINRQKEVTDKINAQQYNLNNVSGNPSAVIAINNNINDLKQKLVDLTCDYVKFEQEYLDIKKDYDDNSLYFKNMAILEGIRNSIAHGHYEFVSNGDFFDTIIVFNDLYEGKLTFQAKISFYDFEKMINENSQIVIKFINDKINVSGSKVLSKK